jgi:transitional endoplasmic reticulum ATPase
LFIPSVKGHELLRLEHNVCEVFSKARTAAPCVLFFDNLDVLFKYRGACSREDRDARDRALNQILAEMDYIHSKRDGLHPGMFVAVIGATNRPDLLDIAICSSGRFDQPIYVRLPDASSRLSILHTALLQSPLATDVNLDFVAKTTTGFSGADIMKLCRTAATLAVKSSVIHARSDSTIVQQGESICKISQFVLFRGSKVRVC